MSANGPIQLTIVTPERPIVQDRVEELEIPGLDGYFGVLPGHAPLFSELKVGIVSYRNGSKWTRIAIADGFAEVLSDHVRILAETAERAQDIDLERAKRSKSRAEERIAKNGDQLDYARAMEALERATVRVEVAKSV